MAEPCEVVEKDKAEGGDAPTGGPPGRDPIQLDVFSVRPSSTDEDNKIVSSAESGAPQREAPSDAAFEARAPATDRADASGTAPTTAPESTGTVVKPDASGVEAGAAEGGSEPGFQLNAATDVGGSSLQSPHDPHVTYGHKGKGNETQLSETCTSDNPYQLITYAFLNGAHESDQNQVIPALYRMAASGLGPSALYADTGYGSGKNVVESGKRGVDLHAPVQSPCQKCSTHEWLEHSVEGQVEPVGARQSAVSEAGE